MDFSKIAIVFVLATLIGCTISQHQFISTSSSVAANGVAYSSSVGDDGVLRGECSYIDSQGRNIKIQFEELNGRVKATTNSPHVKNPEGELANCKKSSEELAQNAQKIGQQITDNIQQGHNQITQQISQLPQIILRQQQQPFRQKIQSPVIQDGFQQNSPLFSQAGDFPAFGSDSFFRNGHSQFNQQAGNSGAFGVNPSTFSRNTNFQFDQTPQGANSFVSATSINGGVSKGQCSYINSEGRQIKIRYEDRNGQITVTPDSPTAQADLRECQKISSQLAQHHQQQAQQTQQQVFRQQQLLQQQLKQQQEALNRQFENFNPFNGFPTFNRFNDFEFPNFNPIF